MGQMTSLEVMWSCQRFSVKKKSMVHVGKVTSLLVLELNLPSFLVVFM